MRIEHVALWTDDVERLRAWYERWLGAQANELYVNEAHRFRSYFLSWGGGARLELMQMEGEPPGLRAHIAFAVGSRRRVDDLTDAMRAAGITVADEPRITGDGYYESVVLDPDGNRVELTE